MAKEMDISVPHGVEQNIKMELLGMIHSAENPFDIIMHIAKYLEKASAEEGYAAIVKDNIRSIYGLALQDKKLMTDEKKDIETRLAHIEQSYQTGDFTDEEKKRIEFAIILHKKNIKRLEDLIHKAEIDGTTMYMDK
jgi:hypothetical protein